jgi:hypothetical protein
MDEEYLKVQQKGGRPIPGQSLTNDPENPAPFEKAPEYTSVHAASEYLFAQMIERESYIPLMQAVADGTPIMEIAQVILFQGFTEGKWNPDLLVMLIEPVAYMLLALAERLDIDPVIYLDEEQDEEDEERALGTKFEELALQKFEKGSEPVKVPAGVLSNEILSQIKEIPEDALETPQQPMEQPPQQASLLAPAQ